MLDYKHVSLVWVTGVFLIVLGQWLNWIHRYYIFVLLYCFRSLLALYFHGGLLTILKLPDQTSVDHGPHFLDNGSGDNTVYREWEDGC